MDTKNIVLGLVNMTGSVQVVIILNHLAYDFAHL
jgi:hypothetical protein